MGKMKELQILVEEGMGDIAKIIIKGKLADEQSQLRMFGETVAEMERMKPPFITNIFYAFMILSDAQEVMASSRERARQYINKAKHFLAKELETQEGVINEEKNKAEVS